MSFERCAARWLGASLLLLTVAAGEVELPPIFSDHLLLQRDQPVPLWGTAAPKELVKVDFADQTKTAVADAHGRWRVVLDPLAASDQPRFLTANAVTLADVLVGDVWLCGGATNMEWTPWLGLKNAAAEIAAADQPKLRLFKVGHQLADRPLDRCEGEWRVGSPAAMRSFSAVAWFFGSALRAKTGVPVGLICNALAGASAESFLRREALAADPALRPLLGERDAWLARVAAARTAHAAALRQWRKDAAKAQAKHKPVPPEPALVSPGEEPQPAGGAWNGMVAPLLSVPLKGIAWYQGEANADSLAHAAGYGPLFARLVTDWRAQFGRPELPFVWVQLANCRERVGTPGDSAWARVREGQAAALRLPATGMAPALDLGEGETIHPLDKQSVGQRLASVALGVVAGQPVAATVFAGATVEGGQVRVRFAGGPVAGTLRGLAVAGADRRWVWADAKLDGETLVVASPAVPAPVAVRYAWADNPEVGLTGAHGLPVAPFRSDDWEVAR